LLIFGCPNYRWNYLSKYLIVTPNNVVAFVITVKCKFTSFSSHAASPMLELIRRLPMQTEILPTS
jgi:hypothetical protein